MDLYGYIDRLEEHFDDEDELRQIVAEAARDDELASQDRELVLERAGTYLADARRAADPDGLGDTDMDWDDARDE